MISSKISLLFLIYPFETNVGACQVKLLALLRYTANVFLFSIRPFEKFIKHFLKYRPLLDAGIVSHQRIPGFADALEALLNRRRPMNAIIQTHGMAAAIAGRK